MLRAAFTYLEGENDSREVSFGELYERALGILYHLQRIGARRGDKLILLLANNEQFIDAYWAAILGGIIPVPVAPGISDEHRHKLLRIARKARQTLSFIPSAGPSTAIGSFAAQAGVADAFNQLRARSFLIDDLDDISAPPGKPVKTTPQDVAFIQSRRGPPASPRVVLTHGNIIANCQGTVEAAGLCPDDPQPVVGCR